MDAWRDKDGWMEDCQLAAANWQLATAVTASEPSDAESLKRKSPEDGQRENPRVYETMPAQMLNAYGMDG